MARLVVAVAMAGRVAVRTKESHKKEDRVMRGGVPGRVGVPEDFFATRIR